MKTKKAHVAQHHVPGYMLREKVSGVLRARDLGEAKVAPAYAVLDPEVKHMQMSDFAEAPSPTYADGGSCIREDLQVELYAEVRGQGLEAQRNGRPTTYATELGFARGQRNRCLCEQTVLYRVGTQHGHAAGSGSARGFTATEVRVHIDTEKSSRALKWKMPDKPWKTEKKSGNPLESFHASFGGVSKVAT